MATNLREIADNLNLSVTTVSRALQNHPRISEETRDRVISTATRMGYKSRRVEIKPSLVPVKEDRWPVTVLAQFDVDAWESGNVHIGPVPFHGGESSLSLNRAIAGISKNARALQVSAVIHYVPLSERDHIAQPEFQPATMKSFQTSGLILVGYFPPEAAKNLAQTWPCVSILHEYPEANIDCIAPDSLRAIGQIMENLYGLGHRKIGFLNYMGHESWAQLCYAGYLRALSRLNLPYIPEIATNIDDRTITPKRELAFVLPHLHQGHKVTAWVCADDVAAYRLYEDLRQHGVKVPEEVSITGYSGMQPPAGFPLMSGIHPPYGTIGGLALQALLERVESPHISPRYTMIRCDMVEGETVSGPKQ